MRVQHLSPPIAPGPNAPVMNIRTYDKAERAYQKYPEARISVCVTLFLSKELKGRINQDPVVSQRNEAKKSEHCGKSPFLILIPS